MTPNPSEPKDDRRFITATFADWRTVKSRKSLQLVFEVSLEQQAEVLTMLGAPMPDVQRWCAIALLNTSSPAGSQSRQHTPDHERTTVADKDRTPEPQTSPAGEHKERRPWETLSPSQQAGILCSDKAFQQWVGHKFGVPKLLRNEAYAAEWLRSELGVRSRAELPDNPRAAGRLNEIRAEFIQWAGRVPVAPR